MKPQQKQQWGMLLGILGVIIFAATLQLAS